MTHPAEVRKGIINTNNDKGKTKITVICGHSTV